MREFEFKGNTYTIGKLSAFQQLHVARKVGPVITKMTETLVSLQRANADAMMGDLFPPAMEVVSHMSEADVNEVVCTCLSVVRRLDNGRPQIVLQGMSPMYQDVDFTVLLQLTIEVCKENLATFFPLLNVGTTSNPSDVAQQ